jgi:hypothetical protein
VKIIIESDIFEIEEIEKAMAERGLFPTRVYEEGSAFQFNPYGAILYTPGDTLIRDYSQWGAGAFTCGMLSRFEIARMPDHEMCGLCNQLVYKHQLIKMDEETHYCDECKKKSAEQALVMADFLGDLDDHPF